MRIGIIGCGVVGDALHYSLVGHGMSEGDIVRYDPKLFDTEPGELVNCTLAFICVPSPMFPDGRQDSQIVRSAMRMLVGIDFRGIAVIKSTVLPTTLQELQESFDIPIVSNPEFLTEKQARSDFFSATFHVVGSDNAAALDVVASLYRRLWPCFTAIVRTSLKTAMLIKYAINAQLALRVSSMNELYRLWQKVGDGTAWKDIVLALQHDDRMGQTHMDVPGPDGQFGFGGKCFPKDLNALIHMAEDVGTPLTTFKAAWDTNEQVRSHRDWHHIEGAMSSTPETCTSSDESEDND